MKKVFVIVCVMAVIAFMFNEPEQKVLYTREDLEEARREGYEEGYSDAEYYLKPDVWKAEDIAAEHGYEHGYEIGYDDGYYDCLEEYGLMESSFDPDNPPRIEKERN